MTATLTQTSFVRAHRCVPPHAHGADHSLYRNLFRDVHNNPDLASTVSVLQYDIDWNDEDSGLSTMRRGFFAILEKDPAVRTKTEIVALSLLLRGCGFVDRFQRSWGRESLLDLIRHICVRSFEAGQVRGGRKGEGTWASAVAASLLCCCRTVNLLLPPRCLLLQPRCLLLPLRCLLCCRPVALLLPPPCSAVAASLLCYCRLLAFAVLGCGLTYP